MDTIKEFWWAVMASDKDTIKSVHPTRADAEIEQEHTALMTNLERVRITIDRIKT